MEGFAEALLAAQRHAVEERLTDVELAWGPGKRVFGADGDADGDPTAPLPRRRARHRGKLREGAAAFAKRTKIPVSLLKEAGFFGEK